MIGREPGIFAGIFALQWGFGLVIDAWSGPSGPTLSAFQGGMALFEACAFAWYLWFLRHDGCLAADRPGE